MSSMTYIPGVGASLKTGRSIVGPTWAGGKAANNAVLPQRRRPMAPLLPLNPAPALMPPSNLPSSGGGSAPSRGRAGGGGGGPSYKFAPTHFDDGSRYNDKGYRADGRKKIQGFSADAAGLPDFGGLNEFYANQESTPGKKGMPATRTNPAFYAGSEDNNQPFSSAEIAGQLDKRNETLVPFAGGIVRTNKPGVGNFDQGGFLPAGQTGKVVQDGRFELAVPLDGSAPVPLTDPMAITAAKDLVILSNDQINQLPQLRQDGITPLGGGRAVMSNQYGTGMAMPGPGGLPMADERGVIDVEAMKASKGRASMAAFPDGYVLQKDRPGLRYVPDPLAGLPMGQMSGIMPNDPALVRQGIAQFQAANQSATNAVNAVDPAAWAAEMQLRNPLLRTWEAGGGTQGRPLPSTMQAPAPRFMPGQAPLTQQMGLPTMPGLPMSAVRGGMTSMNRFLDSRAGREAVGQQMLQQAMTPPEAPLQPWALPVPGGNEVIYGVGRNVMGTRQAPEPQSDEDLLAEAYRVDTPEELRALMGKTRNMAIIKEARSRLDKMTTSSAPTKDVYYDSMNQKFVEIDSRYEPPPELGLKRMPRKGEGRLSRVMETTGGDSAAPPAPNRERNSRYFPGMK
jgi:hypothetical protein